MKRSEAWHDAYKALFSRFGCIRLSVEQAALATGCSARQVVRRYPDGWSAERKGKSIRLDTLLDQEFDCY